MASRTKQKGRKHTYPTRRLHTLTYFIYFYLAIQKTVPINRLRSTDPQHRPATQQASDPPAQAHRGSTASPVKNKTKQKKATNERKLNVLFLPLSREQQRSHGTHALGHARTKTRQKQIKTKKRAREREKEQEQEKRTRDMRGEGRETKNKAKKTNRKRLDIQLPFHPFHYFGNIIGQPVCRLSGTGYRCIYYASYGASKTPTKLSWARSSFPLTSGLTI